MSKETDSLVKYKQEIYQSKGNTRAKDNKPPTNAKDVQSGIYKMDSNKVHESDGISAKITEQEILSKSQ